MFAKLLWIAAAGALGTLSRFGLASLVQRWNPTTFPWGTLVVNVLGCLLFGLVWALIEGKLIHGDARLYVLIGFMGAFTTFSTFAFEAVSLISAKQYLLAAGHIIAENVLGILAVMAGLALGKTL